MLAYFKFILTNIGMTSTSSVRTAVIICVTPTITMSRARLIGVTKTELLRGTKRKIIGTITNAVAVY